MSVIGDNILKGSLKINVKEGPLETLTAKERREDILQLYNLLKDNYPYFSLKKERFGYDWLAHRDDFLTWAESCGYNDEFYLVVKRILMLLQNNHTELLNPLYREYLGEVYQGNNCWSRVLNNKGVIEKYKSWSKLIIPNPYVCPGEFKYFQGQYFYYSRNLREEEKIEQLLEGTILERVSGVPIDKYVTTLIDTRYLHYDYKRNMPIVDTLRVFTEDRKSLTFTFKDKDGNRFSKKLSSYKYYSQSKGKNNSEEQQSNIKIKVSQECKTAYIKINSFASRHIESDGIILEEFFTRSNNFTKILIDIRGNGGGNEEYYMKNIVPFLIKEKKTADFYLLFRNGKYIKPFLKEKGFRHFLKSGELKLTEELPMNLILEEEYRNNFGFFINNSRSINNSKYNRFKGKVYILTDYHTYSAAETFSAFAKAVGMATIVGTTTGGDGVNLDPCVTALKNSGLVIRFAMTMGLNCDGSINEDVHTVPDIYVEQSFQDFLNSKDDLLEFLK